MVSADESDTPFMKLVFCIPVKCTKASCEVYRSCELWDHFVKEFLFIKCCFVTIVAVIIVNLVLVVVVSSIANANIIIIL